MVSFEERKVAGQGRQEPATNREGVGVSLFYWGLWRKVSLGLG